MTDWWGRRPRRAKVWLIVGVVVLVFGIIGALASPDTSEDAAPETTTVVVTEEATTEEATTEETTTEETTTEPPPPPPEPAAPRPIVLRGSGSKVESLRLREDSPLVVTGSHGGSSNFIVDMVGRGGSGDFFLFNEIGGYEGEVAVAEATAGRYRVKVDADGSWELRFEQPVPTGQAKTIPGRIKGRGARVVRLRSTEDLEPIVTARHRGQSNFIVDVIGYGDIEGSIFLFNEIGDFSGETLAEQMPAGDYLLSVQADGPWTIRFTP